VTKSKLLRIFNEKGELEESLYEEAVLSKNLPKDTLTLVNEIFKAVYGHAILDKMVFEKITSVNKEENA
jgi:hypothetical protein